MKSKAVLCGMVSLTCFFAMPAYTQTMQHTRTADIQLQDLRATATLVDIKPDFSKRIYVQSDWYATEEEAMEEANFRALVENRIDILLDPIYRVEHQNQKVRIHLSGLSGYYTNPRPETPNETLLLSISAMDRVKRESLEKYLMLTNPEWIPYFYQADSTRRAILDARRRAMEGSDSIPIPSMFISTFSVAPSVPAIDSLHTTRLGKNQGVSVVPVFATTSPRFSDSVRVDGTQSVVPRDSATAIAATVVAATTDSAAVVTVKADSIRVSAGKSDSVIAPPIVAQVDTSVISVPKVPVDTLGTAKSATKTPETSTDSVVTKKAKPTHTAKSKSESHSVDAKASSSAVVPQQDEAKP